MSRISELNQKIRSQDARIKTCEYYEDWDGAELAAEQRRKLVQQKAIVEEYVQAKGQITVFEDASKVSHLEIARCRKRSAILLGSVMQLPLIPAGRVAFPNVFLRSSLFGIWSPKKGSPKLLHQQIPCEKGYEIGYSGPALWQKDFLLMAVLLKMAGENLQAPVKTTLGELRRWMKFHDGKANNEAVMNSLDRLGSGTLRVRKQDDDKVWFDGALVEYQTAVDGQVTAVTFKLNAGWGWLFGVGRWSSLPFDKFKALQRKEFAIWLGAYLSTHDGNVPMALDRLYELSGLSTEKFGFRRSLKEALAECLGQGILRRGELTDDDMVTFQRAAKARPKMKLFSGDKA